MTGSWRGLQVTDNGKNLYCLKFGFTLAEVLITLGIIGVVAAMTMPALTAKYQQKVFVTKMKYTYTVLSNAFLMARADYGDPTTWDWGEEPSRANMERIVKTYVSPYLSKMNEGFVDNTSQYYYIRLKNGVTIVFSQDGCTDPNQCAEIDLRALYMICSIDDRLSYNNSEDRDYSRKDFLMKFHKNSNKMIYFTPSQDRNAVINSSMYGCNKNVPRYKRMNCGQLIYLDGWEIKDDYPW